MKVFIITTPCSGKSFTIKHEGLECIYDGDRLKREGKIKKEDALEMIDVVPKGSIIMGKPHEPYFDKCEYLSVLIPKDTLSGYLEKRKKKKWKKWNSHEKIDLLRNEIKMLSEKYNLKMFNSLKEAVCEAKKYLL